MSVWILDDKFYRRLLNNMERFREDIWDCSYTLKENLAKVGITSPIQWVNAIRKINYESYAIRYSEPYNEDKVPQFPEDELVKRTWGTGDKIQFYKDLRCLQYQIEHIENPLQIDVLERRIANHIIFKLPEYDERDWG